MSVVDLADAPLGSVFKLWNALEAFRNATLTAAAGTVAFDPDALAELRLRLGQTAFAYVCKHSAELVSEVPVLLFGVKTALAGASNVVGSFSLDSFKSLGTELVGAGAALQVRATRLSICIPVCAPPCD